MMQIMNVITDKPEWERKVFDEHIIAKWREEVAQSGHDATPKMMDWIVKELQWKAGILEQTGFVEVFDAGVVKSDTVVSKELQDELKEAVVPFENVPEEEKDYHPGSDNKVVNPCIRRFSPSFTDAHMFFLIGRSVLMTVLTAWEKVTGFRARRKLKLLRRGVLILIARSRIQLF